MQFSTTFHEVGLTGEHHTCMLRKLMRSNATDEPIGELSEKEEHIKRLEAKLKAKQISELDYVSELSIYTSNLQVGLHK